MAKKDNKAKKAMSLLGTGAARKAGGLLSGRAAQLEAQIRGAVNGSMRKKKKQ